MSAPNIATVLSFGQLLLNDLRGASCRRESSSAHLAAAVDWLKRAQDQGNDDGVSYGYSLRGGWRPSYVETTGYIAVTFFRLAEREPGRDYRERALRMVDWLMGVQLPDGSFSNESMARGRGIVFDTGQDLFGLVRAARETGEPSYLQSARRAGEWLVGVSDASGRWTRSTHRGVPHVYNSRTAWALLQLHRVHPADDFERVARANLDWAVSQQGPEGLYDNCAFSRGKAPFTHTIAYAMRGLWEAGELLGEDRYRASAVRAANALLPRVAESGFIPGQIDVRGRPAARYCCLTGNAQLSIVWAKMFKRDGDERYRTAALRALRYVMMQQDLETRDLDRRGAIKGSHPTWGSYSPFTYPNWATKFFVDALLECEGLDN